MKNSTLLGSAASVLLLFSVIAYSRTYIQQDPKPISVSPSASQQSNSAAESAAAGAPGISAATLNADRVAAAQTFTATAYSLRGRTASGKPVARGLIAADPRVLPLGTRVRIESGMFSGDYLVADTGGAVKGRRIDIWTPSTREAMRFGRRPVKLTVLEYGGPRGRATAARARKAYSQPQTPSVAEQTTKQN